VQAGTGVFTRTGNQEVWIDCKHCEISHIML